MLRHHFGYEYTAWCNGECYWFSIKDDQDTAIDCCGGFIGTAQLFDVIAEVLKPGDEIIYTGEAADVARSLRFDDNPNDVDWYDEQAADDIDQEFDHA